jgi:HD superfamily phosphohydrolase
MFQQVYFHKSTRAAEAMVRSILSRAVELVANGERLPVRLPALEAAAAGRVPTLDEYLELDDGVLLGAIHGWETARDPILATLSTRLRARALFKTIELGGVESELPIEEAFARASEVATARGLDPRYFVAVDRASDTPYPAEAALQVIFPDDRARDLGEVSFLLGRLKGQTLSRTRLLFAAELREDIKRALAR